MSESHEPPPISVVLLVRDEIRTLPRLLDALDRQEGIGPFEVIAIDSGSVDGSAQLLRGRKGVRLLEIPPEDFHHSRTRNLGAETARGEIVVWLAADAVPLSPRWLAELTAPFSDDRVAATYGRQVARPDHGPRQHFQQAFSYPDTPEVRTANGAGVGRSYSMSNVNSAVRRAFWKANPYPTDLPICEDIAMSKAALDAGRAVAYVPTAAVEHSHAYSVTECFRRYYAIGDAYRALGLTGRGRGPSARRDGLAYAHREAIHCLKAAGPVAAVESLAASAAKALGYLAGRQKWWLPPFLRSYVRYRPRPLPSGNAERETETVQA